MASSAALNTHARHCPSTPFPSLLNRPSTMAPTTPSETTSAPLADWFFIAGWYCYHLPEAGILRFRQVSIVSNYGGVRRRTVHIIFHNKLPPSLPLKKTRLQRQTMQVHWHLQPRHPQSDMSEETHTIAYPAYLTKHDCPSSP